MPTLDLEHELLAHGYRRIAGVDEAGRGCWAGPVAAAAVVLGARALADTRLLTGIDDSKRLSPPQREAMRTKIVQLADGVGVGLVPAFLIDLLGLMRATELAMELAVLQLPVAADALLVDAVRLRTTAIPQRSIIRGDQLSYSIAAASIIAKTARDRLMQALEQDDARYGFAKHKGYGTALHQAALLRWGPCPEHRRSFRPLWNKEYQS